MCLCHMADAILGYNLTNSGDLFSNQYDKFVKPKSGKSLKGFVRMLVCILCIIYYYSQWIVIGHCRILNGQYCTYLAH